MGLSDKSFLHSCDVGFEDVKLTLQQKGKEVDKRDILDGSFKGIARSGRMVCSFHFNCLANGCLYIARSSNES